MALPRHFGMACEIEDFGPDGLYPDDIDQAPGFSWTLLQRHGRRPLAVLGRVLLQANNRCAGLASWSEIYIYETVACRYAAAVRHATTETPGPDWCDAWMCDSAEAVRTVFYKHDPLVALSATTASGPVGLADIERLDAAMSRHVVEAQRFRGAWAGLLAAMFGLPATRQAVR
jgi:hypothetical protein